MLHRGDEIEQTADHDLLALRLKHSHEKICGRILPRDDALESQLDAAGRNVALVVQVKTGKKSGAGKAFEPVRLGHAIRFLGVVPPDEAQSLAASLTDKPKIEHGIDWTIAKLLVSERPRNMGNLGMTLDDALKFVSCRLASFAKPKAADRLFFPGELMQFLAWSALKNHETR